MKISEHANYLLNEYGRLQFDYAAYYKPNGESLRNEARNNLEEYIAELEMKIRHNALWQASEDAEERAHLEKLVPDLNKRIAELEELVDELVDSGDNLFDSLNPVAWKHEWLDKWWKLSNRVRKEREE